MGTAVIEAKEDLEDKKEGGRQGKYSEFIG